MSSSYQSDFMAGLMAKGPKTAKDTRSKEEQPLPAVEPPVAVLPLYTQHKESMTLKIRERRGPFVGDDFSVKDAMTGQTIFQCEGRPISFNDKKVIRDAENKPIFQIKHLKWDATYYVETPSPEKRPLCSFRQIPHLFRTEVEGSFTNALGGGGEVKLHFTGDHRDATEIKTDKGIVVGRTKRDYWNAGQLFFDKQTYFLEVAPGVDAALLVAFIIVLDECAHD